MSRVLTNDFSWSKSRHEKLQDCHRAYYFHYYASWGGWDANAPQSARQLYILKKLSNRFTWAGSLVHQSIKEVLNDIRFGRPVDAANVIDWAHRRMQRDYRHSMKRAYWQEKGRREFTGLVEHEYGEPVTNADWKAAWESVKAALEWFLASPWMEKASALGRDQWLEVDESFETANFALHGLRVFAIPDFAYLEEDGTPRVIDWKTGQARDGYDAQVLGYALYVAQRYGFPVQKVRATLVYLNEGKEQEVQVDNAGVDAFLELFRTSVARMKSLLLDAESNVPLAESDFPANVDLKSCTRCVFRRACGREQVPLALPVARVA
jgi:RecB family exonuclease